MSARTPSVRDVTEDTLHAEVPVPVDTLTDEQHGPKCPYRGYFHSQRIHPGRHMLHTMSTTLLKPPERSAAEVNEEIRALWRRSGGRLTTEQRAEYQRLVMEWVAAVP